MEVEIELFGIPRRRAGKSVATIQCSGPPFRLSELIDALTAQFPDLSNDADVIENRYRNLIVCVNEERFVRCPDDLLDPSERILVMSADVGG